MILIVCLDDNNGMLFNKRRQSSDRVLCQKILARTGGKPLWLNAYSQTLFQGMEGNLRVDARFAERAGRGEYCFAENIDVTPYIASAEEIFIYRWNRVYPSDLRFPIQLLADGWKLTVSVDFVGSSHEQITQEVYTR